MANGNGLPIRARDNTELEQTFIRLFLVVCGLIYGIALSATGMFAEGYPGPVIKLGCGYAAFSIVAIVHVFYQPQGWKYRHSMYMSIDILVISLVMHGFNEYGVPFFACYLWMTVGNGFRYGYRQLILCAGLSLCGFGLVCLTTPYWQEQHSVAITCILLLSMLPLYFSLLLNRFQRAKDRVEAASREKSRFLANISHEIRTPLNAVIGFSRMLGKIAERPEQVRIVSRIDDASRSLMSLIGGVLDYSRIEAGQLQLKRETFDLYQLLYSVAGMLSIGAEEKRVRLITDLDVTVPPLVSGDAVRLRQVLVNLLGNAVKFTDVGEICLKVSRADAAGSRVLFEVIDTGVGIPEEMQSRIFERFFQADDSTRGRCSGAGLGTAIAKRLVELMGGEIGLESVECRGSRFWFAIPLAGAGHGDAERRPGYTVISTSAGHSGAETTASTLQAVFAGAVRVYPNRAAYRDADTGSTGRCLLVDCRGLATEDMRSIVRDTRSPGACLIAYHPDRRMRDRSLRAGFQVVMSSPAQIGNALHYGTCCLQARVADGNGGSHPRSRLRFDGLRVLHADDCRLNRYVMREMLNELGIEPELVASGDAALEKLQHRDYDVIMLDNHMPGLSGADVIREYRKLRPADVSTPIVVISGEAGREVTGEFARLGVSRFLIKPVDHCKLAGTISSLVRKVGNDAETPPS